MLFFIATPSAQAVAGQQIADVADRYLGYPYASHAAGPDAFDCGGFVWYVCHMAGAEFPLRIESKALAAANTPIYDVNELQPGDILFFGSSPDNIGHWGLYAGDGEVIHAYNSAVGVVYTALDAVCPAFCYGCRLNGVAQEDTELAQAARLSGAEEAAGIIVDRKLIPIAYRNNYHMEITAEQSAELLYEICETACGASREELVTIVGADRHLWSNDAVALLSRAYDLIVELSESEEPIFRYEAATALLDSLYTPKGSDSAALAPHVAPMVPFEALAADINAEEKGAVLINAATPRLTAKNSNIFTRYQAFATTQSIYELLVQIPFTTEDDD